MFRVFCRTWWEDCPGGPWPNNLKPVQGKKRWLPHSYDTEDQARAACKRFNATPMSDKQKRLGFKYEYTDVDPT